MDLANILVITCATVAILATLGVLLLSCHVILSSVFGRCPSCGRDIDNDDGDGGNRGEEDDDGDQGGGTVDRCWIDSFRRN